MLEVNFIRSEDGLIVDSNGDEVEMCKDSNYILMSIKDEKDVLLACASRTPTIEIARHLLRLRGWTSLFDYMEIYPASKIKHFAALSRKSGVSYNEMIFFDDLDWNVREVQELGVHAHLVPNGITASLFRRALKQYEQLHLAKRAKNKRLLILKDTVVDTNPHSVG
ncbi:unnamed protein product [Calicophoron daubneyi]|uniref:Magnesium-dependent phosphatase 1 n=1 Tax=Calicophoron daubneyi TaxID=300641 RepID=A0AAV2TZR2_CALDB